jgi:hypothetical protein
MITILDQPEAIHAAYNPIKFTITSDNKAKQGFRYIVKIRDAGGGIGNLLATLKLPPNFDDLGKARVDISSIIRNKVDSFLNLPSTVVNNAPETFYKYDIEFGESFDYEWSYQDYVFPGGQFSLTSDSVLVPGGSDIAHNYSIGDQIFIQNNVPVYGDTRDRINGYHTVVSIISSKTIGVSVTGVSSGTSVTGKTRYADFSKIPYSPTAAVNNMLAVNVAQDVIEYSLTTGDLADYLVGSDTKKFLTNMSDVDKFYATEEQSLFVNMLDTNTSQTNLLFFENDAGEVFTKNNVSTPSVKSNSVGPANLGTLTVLSGTLPLIKPDTKYYDVFVGIGTGTPLSEKLRIYIDYRCKINTTEILFMDRKGSFMGFAFQNREFETVSTEKKTYRKYVEDIETYSDGLVAYHSKYSRQIKLNSNFMSETMNDYYQELVTSRYTLIKYEGIWYSCTVQDTTVEVETNVNNKNIKKSLTVTLDLSAPIN